MGVLPCYNIDIIMIILIITMNDNNNLQYLYNSCRLHVLTILLWSLYDPSQKLRVMEYIHSTISLSCYGNVYSYKKDDNNNNNNKHTSSLQLIIAPAANNTRAASTWFPSLAKYKGVNSFY